MSRFSDEGSDYPAHWWSIDLERALTSGRGKRILADIEQALLALPEHRLIDGSIVRYDEDEGHGDVCAVGAYAAWQQVKVGKTWAEAMEALAERWSGESDEWETQALGMKVGMARTVAWQLAFENDGGYWEYQPTRIEPFQDERRWWRVLNWVRECLHGEPLMGSSKPLPSAT